MKKNKIVYIIIAVIVLLLITLGVYSLNKKSADNQPPSITEETSEDEDTLTPEEVLEQMDEEASTILSDDIYVSIISPEGDSFSIGQARNWEAEFTGIEKGTLKASCTWEFYMNDELYRTMENTSATSADDPTACGFTSTFIDVYGKVDVRLKIDLSKSSEDWGTYTTSREYSVL